MEAQAVPCRGLLHCSSVRSNVIKQALARDSCSSLQALIDAEDAEQMAAELYVLERQLSSLRHSVPAEVADAAQEAKRQAKATVHQAMSSPTEAGEDVSECAAAGSGLDEPASSGASDTSAFSGITDALLSNPKFSAGAEGGREERQGSDRCEQCCRAMLLHGERRFVSAGAP